jgi:enoyl-CoA hydratase/carnithine racemase
VTDLVTYELRDRTAWIALNRPEYRNAQNSALLYALDDAFKRAASDDDVKVIVLHGHGPSFSAGHDIGSPGRDVDEPYERVSLWWDHTNKEGAERRFGREDEVYLGLCRRWRDLPKPTIAMVHGHCLGAGLMLAWICDLIIASEETKFGDPVVQMGVGGVEYFAHPWEMSPRLAKEFLMLGQRIDARRAYEIGMVNRVVARDALEAETQAVAERIAEMPRFALALVKRAVNVAEEAMGLRVGMEAAFGLHHLAHSHNVELGKDLIGGQSVGSMRAADA